VDGHARPVLHGQDHGGRVRRAGRPASARRPDRDVRPGRRRALQQRTAARVRRQVPRAVRVAQQLPADVVDDAPGRPAAAHGVPAVRVQRPAGAHGPRPAAGQHGRRGRVRGRVPADAPALEPADAEETPGRGRVPGRVGGQRQSGVGQHALVVERRIAHRARRKGDRWDARHAAETFTRR